MSTLDPQTLEELTAYLDGELDAVAVRQVEDRLAADPAYRDELTRLQRAWDLLDRLPRCTVGESFTRTTMEMVAVAAEEELAAQTAQLPRRRRRRGAAAAVGVAVAAVAGFVVGRQFWPDPNAALIRDLPVIENLEMYRQAESLEFLRRLHDSGLFGEEADHDG